MTNTGTGALTEILTESMIKETETTPVKALATIPLAIAAADRTEMTGQLGVSELKGVIAIR